MAEYIEREAALNRLCQENCDHDYVKDKCQNCYVSAFIEYAPSADVVPVVRCKDCLYWQSGENECDKWEYCTIHNIGIGPHSFCSYGERKDGEG